MARAAELRAEGLSLRQIAERLSGRIQRELLEIK